MAKDAENNVEETQVAPEVEDTQGEQAVDAEESTNAPSAPEDKEEKILGKFNSQEELEKSYQESEAKLTQTLQEKAELEKQLAGGEETQPAAENFDNTVIDPSVEPALDRWYNQRREAEKAVEFQRKHQDELKDPVLDGTVRRIIAEKNAKNEYVDQEEALAEAQKLLDARIKPQVNSAKTEGVEEGQEIARKKEQAGAIGDVGARDKVDPDKLSSKDYAKYHGLKYEE